MTAAGQARVLGELGQISRSVDDLDAAVVWYRDVLGLPLLQAFDALAFFACGGVRLMLVPERGVTDSILYFRVADIDAAQADLTARGVAFIRPPHRVHRHEDGSEEWMAFFEDPQGRPLGLMCLKRAPDPD